MDDMSYSLMEYFVEKYVRGDKLSLCDVGSLDINGTFKDLFKSHDYIGVDITEGPNVDVVSKDSYRYPFEDGKFDVVISGSTIEHVKDIFSWIKELVRITKNGGLICVVGPTVLRIQHRHPVDCWRIYPDGMRYLLGEVANVEVLEARRSERSSRGTILCIGVGRK
jgi:SAM-dependent methyltransferase